MRTRTRKVNFSAINAAALPALPALLRRWLPDGRIQGHEYVALNPNRNDRSPGSFRINLHTAKWADFATGDKGSDPISLVAYLRGERQVDAALALAECLGVSAYE